MSFDADSASPSASPPAGAVAAVDPCTLREPVVGSPVPPGRRTPDDMGARHLMTASGSDDGTVEVRGVNKTFRHQVAGKDLKVLDNISVSFEGGTFTSVVGPSGCGKSTLLRIIDGLMPPDSGGVMIGGESVKEPSLDRGFVFQQFNLLPWRTVMGNIEFGLENLGVKKDERQRRAQAVIKLVALEGFERYYPGQLSGGMQQRVGLARALAVDPTILLMDEPFGSVDDQTRMLLQDELLGIWEGNQKTVIFVTHDIEEALYLADRWSSWRPAVPGHANPRGAVRASSQGGHSGFGPRWAGSSRRSGTSSRPGRRSRDDREVRHRGCLPRARSDAVRGPSRESRRRPGGVARAGRRGQGGAGMVAPPVQQDVGAADPLLRKHRDRLAGHGDDQGGVLPSHHPSDHQGIRRAVHGGLCDTCLCRSASSWSGSSSPW